MYFLFFLTSLPHPNLEECRVYCCFCQQVKSSRNLKYKDYFDAVDSEPAEADAPSDVEDDSMNESGEAETDEDEEEDHDMYV